MQGDPKSDAPEAVKPEGVTPDSVTLDKQPTGPVQPVAQAYQQPAPQAAQQAYRQPAPQAAQTYQQPAPQQAQAYQQPAPNAYRGYQQPAPQQAYRNYQQPQPPYQQPPRQAQPAYQQPAPQNYRQPAPNYAAQPGSTDFESVIMGLRNRKLRRLGFVLLFTWLAFVIGALIVYIGLLATDRNISSYSSFTSAYGLISSSRVSISHDFGNILLIILTILLSPALMLLFEYSGFAYSYEGRHFPSFLFAFILGGSHVGSSVAALISTEAFSALFSGRLPFAGVMLYLGLILFCFGIILNGLLFIAYAFSPARYNGKAFMIMGLIFAIMVALGLLMIIIASFVSGSASGPWWGYVSLFFLLAFFVMYIISYVIGYAPARDGYSRFGGGPAGGYRAY